MPKDLPDDRRTLDELEGVQWGPPTYNSYVVTTSHRLRAKPLTEFTVEDLRFMIAQGIGLPFLVPLALEVVEADPLARGDYYAGDLLRSLLTVSSDFWAREWEWRDRLHGIVERLAPVPANLAEAISSFEGRAAPR